jgi:hypothetical protein
MEPNTVFAPLPEPFAEDVPPAPIVIVTVDPGVIT